MKIIVNSLDLNDAIAKVAKALPVREVAPVLECIKVTAENDLLTLYATDRDLAIEKTIKANVIVGGSFLVQGKIFGEYIRSIAENDTDVSLEIDEEEKLSICSSGSECTISTLNVEDYPETEQISNEKSFSIQEINLKDAINNVIFSVSADDSRPMLKGVFFEAKEGVLTTVATDGYRFALSRKSLEKNDCRISATVPSRSLNELSKLLSDGDGLIDVYVEDNYMLVELENTKLYARLLTGQYINFENIVPKDFGSTLYVNKEQFEKSLNIASIMSRSEKNNLVTFDIQEYSMYISSTSQYGSATENVPISLTGKDVKCAYNSRYINDCLRVINADTIKIEFAQHSSCVITIKDSTEVLYFILPVKQIY